MASDSANRSLPQSDFIREIVARDREAGVHGGRVVTRFPPEPNGHLHIGHAKSVFLNFGIAAENGGLCRLRFDDTNPERESEEFVRAIREDILWLLPEAEGQVAEPLFASNYFSRLHQHAVALIRLGKAFVCDQSPQEFMECRGTSTSPGRESPCRDRSIGENLDLFERMRRGEFPEGSRTLRARIDMASPNIHLRDPALYRIRDRAHHRTGSEWRIYPTYDFAHCLSDAIEGVTHSLCTLEFAVHRPLYDWILESLLPPGDRPRQYEFARLNLGHTVLSKRRLTRLVGEGKVAGWDDPRMPTLSGLRRRGVPPEAIRSFCEEIGVTRYDGLTDPALLEHHVRENLNRRAPRVMGVLDPLRVVIGNLPPRHEEEMEAVNNPEDEDAGVRLLPFSREILIDRADFMEDPPPGYFRLRPGGEVRLRYAYILRCTGVERNAKGGIDHLQAEIDPDSRHGRPGARRRVRGTVHWVSAPHALEAQVRLYDRLFTVADPSGEEFMDHLNPASLVTRHDCRLEPSLARAGPGVPYQFERLGYFCLDATDSRPDRPVFNRIVTLRARRPVARGMVA